MKYGSFIPLSETDVLEYLKSKGNSDLSNRSVCTKLCCFKLLCMLCLNNILLERYSVVSNIQLLRLTKCKVYQMNNDIRNVNG